MDFGSKSAVLEFACMFLALMVKSQVSVSFLAKAVGYLLRPNSLQ